MTPAIRRWSNLLGSILVPPVVLITLVFINEELQPWGRRALGLWAPMLSVALGFGLIVREFRLYSLAVGIIYLPLLFILSSWLAYMVGILFYGSQY